MCLKTVYIPNYTYQHLCKYIQHCWLSTTHMFLQAADDADSEDDVDLQAALAASMQTDDVADRSVLCNFIQCGT